MEYKQITLTEIYIPICFYFNTIRFFTCIICTNIYIPICFYFNAKSFVKSSYVLLFTFQYVSILMSMAANLENPKSYIYIPICFYFNIGSYRFRIKTDKFTFQYVSILIPFFEKHTRRVLSFTFQYVSILIMRE